MDAKLLQLQWRLSFITQVATIIAGFVFPAWVTAATQQFQAYAPLSWTVAGFAGMLLVALMWALVGYGYRSLIRARYDARLIESSGIVNPMDRTLEGKRIFVDHLVLPSHPHILNKTFVDCEIIGPANIYLVEGSQAVENKLPRIDAVFIAPGHKFHNGVAFHACLFKGCSFQRITIFVDELGYNSHKDSSLLRWVTQHPRSENEVDTRNTVPGQDNESSAERT